MRQAPAAAALLGIMSYNMLLMLILSCATTITITNAHDITSILASHPEFSTFNKYLSITGLNVQINARKAVTVLAVDNAGMSELISINNTTGKIALRRSQVVVIILDYYLDAEKLHEMMMMTNSNSNNNGAMIRAIRTNATMFGASGGSGDDPRSTSSGYMDISFVKEVGKVAFRSTKDGLLESYFVRCVEQTPSSSTISVLQVISSQLLKSNHQAPSMAELNSDSPTESLSRMGDRRMAQEKDLAASLEVSVDVIVDANVVVSVHP